MDVAQDFVNPKGQLPLGVIGLERVEVANPPHVVTDPRLIGKRVIEGSTGDLFAERNRLQHRDVRISPTTKVVNRASGRRPVKRVEGSHYVMGVNVVANLLALVTEHGVGIAADGALHQVGEEAVKLRASVLRAGQATSTKADGRHLEVAPVLLDQQVGSCF